MNVTIRQESEADHQVVFDIIRKAFETETMSDHREQFLVERLRKSNAFIPELSLVATVESTIVGHILLTKLKIKNEPNEFDSLALAPVSVLPEYQGKGIGGSLITTAHQTAKELGCKSIVLVGHARYYPRFGYQQAHLFNVQLPFDIPKENCMVKELVKGGLDGVSGKVEYPREFNE